MGNLGRFSALNTKIKAMSPGLVSRDNYQDLEKLDSERAIARYLHENTRFKSVFSLYNIESLKRWEIELIIAKEIIRVTRAVVWATYRYLILSAPFP